MAPFSVNPVDPYSNWQDHKQSGGQQPSSQKKREKKTAEPAPAESTTESGEKKVSEFSPVGQRIDVQA